MKQTNNENGRVIMTMPHEIMVRSHPQRPIPESVSSAAKVGEERNIFSYDGSETAYFEGCFYFRAKLWKSIAHPDKDSGTEQGDRIMETLLKSRISVLGTEQGDRIMETLLKSLISGLN